MHYISHYLNDQKYQECQVVTAINIYQRLTRKRINPTSKLYEELVDLAGARYGGAIRIKPVHQRLGIKPDRYFKHIYAWRCQGRPLPIELHIWHPHYGFHSCAAVDYVAKCEALRVANLLHHTTCTGWIFLDEIAVLLKETRAPDGWVNLPEPNKPWVIRSFRLAERKV